MANYNMYNNYIYYIYKIIFKTLLENMWLPCLSEVSYRSRDKKSPIIDWWLQSDSNVDDLIVNSFKLTSNYEHSQLLTVEKEVSYFLSNFVLYIYSYVGCGVCWSIDGIGKFGFHTPCSQWLILCRVTLSTHMYPL